MISYMISPLPSTSNHAAALAGADISESPAIRTDHDSNSDQVMAPNEDSDFADQGFPSDFEMEEDTHSFETHSRALTQLALSHCCKTFQCSRLW
jgi:hypothetical protein